jgi:hypothetical protein
VRTCSLRRLTAVTALALASVAAAAACTSTPTPLAPIPVDTAPASAAPTTASPPPAASTAPVQPVHVAPTGSGSTGSKCLGTIVHRINAADTGPPWKPLCISVGGVLRFENLGPGNLRAIGQSKAECWYEAGVHECRLVQTGTVRFTVTQGETSRSLTVTITKAPSDPGPACPPVATYTLDAGADNPPWPAICMKLNTTLRVVNFGPDGFSVSPAANVSGGYEAGVRQFRFVKTGTVRFTWTYPDGGTRTFTVVVNK